MSYEEWVRVNRLELLHLYRQNGSWHEHTFQEFCEIRYAADLGAR